MLAVTPAPQPTATPEPSPADTRFKPARLLKHPAPAYPELALLNRAEGVVKVRFGIDDQGHVISLAIVKSSGSAMIDSVILDMTLQRDWTFQPATLDGQPVPSSLDQELEFRLDPEQQRQFARQRLALPEGFPDPPYPPEAIPLKAAGSCTLGITWTPAGLVDLIYVDKGSGSNILDRAALRWAFLHWRIDPKNIVYPKGEDGKDQPFLRTVTFRPPST